MARPKRKERVEHTLARVAQAVLRSLRLNAYEVEVFLLGKREMEALKRKCTQGRRPQKAVDVLAFEEKGFFPHPERRRRLLGEVYLNRDLHSGDRKRLSFLLIHGILHCAGYRHRTRRDTMVMEGLEKKLWHRVSSLV